MCSIIRLGPIEWSSYFILTLVGIFAAFLYWNVVWDKLKISFKQFCIMGVFMVFGLVLGSKILFVVTKLPDICKHFSIQYAINSISTAGFVFYGGLFGMLLGLRAFCNLKNRSYHTTVNLLTPGFPIFHVFGRIGCLLAGCCYGFECSNGIQMEDGVTRFPIQLVEALGDALIAFALIKISNKHKDKLLEIYLVSYAIMRFILEFARGDRLRGIWFGLSTSQWISLIIIIVYSIKFYKQFRCSV